MALNNANSNDWEKFAEKSDYADSRVFMRSAADFLLQKMYCDIYFLGRYLERLEKSDL